MVYSKTHIHEKELKMPVTVKQKQKHELKSVAEVGVHLAEQVDQLGELKDQIDKLNKKLEPLQEQFDSIKKELMEWVNKNVPADKKEQLVGEIYEALFGMRSLKTEITDKEKAFELLNKIEPGLAMKLAKFNITDLKAYLTPDELSKCVKQERTGHRTLKLKRIK